MNPLPLPPPPEVVVGATVPRLLQISHLKEAISWDVAQEVQDCIHHLQVSLGTGVDHHPGGGIISREVVVQLFCLAEKVFGCIAAGGGGCPWPQCPQAFDVLTKGTTELINHLVNQLSTPLTQPSQGGDGSTTPTTELELISLVCERLLELNRFVGNNFMLLSTVWKGVVQLARSHYRGLQDRGLFRSQEALGLLVRYADEGADSLKTLLKDLASKLKNQCAAAAGAAGAAGGRGEEEEIGRMMEVGFNSISQIAKLMSFFLLRINLLATLFGPSLDKKVLKRVALLLARYRGCLDHSHALWVDMKRLLLTPSSPTSSHQAILASLDKIRTHANQQMLPKVDSTFIKIIAGPPPVTPPSSSPMPPPPPISSSSPAAAMAQANEACSICFITAAAGLVDGQQVASDQAINLGIIRLFIRALQEGGSPIQRTLPSTIRCLLRALLSLYAHHASSPIDLKGLAELRSAAAQAIALGLARQCMIDASMTQSQLLAYLFDPHPIIRHLWLSTWQAFLRHCHPSLQDHLLQLLINMMLLPSLGHFRRAHLSLIIPQLFPTLSHDIKVPLLTLLVSHTMEALKKISPPPPPAAAASIDGAPPQQQEADDTDVTAAVVNDLTNTVRLCALAFQDVGSGSSSTNTIPPGKIQATLRPFLRVWCRLELGPQRVNKGLGGLGLGWALAYWNEVVPAFALPADPCKSLNDAAVKALSNVANVSANNNSNSNDNEGEYLEVAIAALATIAARRRGGEGEGASQEEAQAMMEVCRQVSCIIETPPDGLSVADFAIHALPHVTKMTRVILASTASDQGFLEEMDTCLANLWQSFLASQAPWPVQARAQFEVEGLRKTLSSCTLPRPLLLQAWDYVGAAAGGGGQLSVDDDETIQSQIGEEARVLQGLTCDVLAYNSSSSFFSHLPGGGIPPTLSGAIDTVVGRKAILVPLPGLGPDQHAIVLVPGSAWSSSSSSSSIEHQGGGHQIQPDDIVSDIMKAASAGGAGGGEMTSGLVTNWSAFQQEGTMMMTGDDASSLKIQIEILPK